MYVVTTLCVSVMFKGAITDLQTVTNGQLHATSAYQWHCVTTTSTSNLKTVNEIKNAGYSQLSCSTAKCWSLKSNSDHYIANLVTPKADCSITVTATVSFILASFTYNCCKDILILLCFLLYQGSATF